MANRRIKTTEDGSSTLFVPELDEHYHSIHGAIQESNHVFIEAGLKNLTSNEIVIFEVGFGTGLNAFLTYLQAIKSNKKIRYITIEKYPLTANEVQSINYPRQLNIATDIFQQIHLSEWNKWISISLEFEIYKINGDIQNINLSEFPLFNLVYFDAFAPNKQPKLWNQNIYRKIYEQCTLNAILTTYCAKGVVRRDMQSVGFKMERIPGPPGKKEMLRGIK